VGKELRLRSGFTSARRYDHYSLPRAIEEALGRCSLGRADQSASSMREFLTAA